MSEWEFVKPKKRKGQSKGRQQGRQPGRVSEEQRRRALHECVSEGVSEEASEGVTELLLRLTDMREAVRTTDFFLATQRALRVALRTKSGSGSSSGSGADQQQQQQCFSRAVLLGLGCFSAPRCTASLLQLALALELLADSELFHPPASAESQSQSRSSDSPCSLPTVIFDPVMTARDSELCEALGLTVATQESDAIHLQPVREDIRTFFYMPHCPYVLYNHIIWTNWQVPQLTSFVILGNSFDSYNMRHLGQSLSSSAPWDCVRNLVEILDEQCVWSDSSCSTPSSVSRPPCLSYMENAFNDLRYIYVYLFISCAYVCARVC